MAHWFTVCYLAGRARLTKKSWRIWWKMNCWNLRNSPQEMRIELTLENRHQKNFDVNCCSSYSLNLHALLIFYKITHVLHEFEDANKRCRDYKNAKIKCKDMERQWAFINIIFNVSFAHFLHIPRIDSMPRALDSWRFHWLCVAFRIHNTLRCLCPQPVNLDAKIFIRCTGQMVVYIFKELGTT